MLTEVKNHKADVKDRFHNRQTHKYPTGASCTMPPTLPGPSVVRNAARSCILTIQSHSQPIPHESCVGQPVSTELMNYADAKLNEILPS